ncbi:putative tricarboxylic transport membrane protein [Pacificibacter maritimus]|uniref:Putative tricarboxylic transport membrane protein n=1 Tax=Pacificibacter maritimus TaxID=762213 RepID=A0A3N4UX43_9RHOB|nr:tripartite tricarboxylate transporter permease [Pacificibacter maritimus]RPE72151.1 putative tricarboxylic transport membrane protein [Pacificibacter maritimus]
MTLFDGFLLALSQMTEPYNLLLLGAGVLAGLLVGAIPGFSITMAVVIVLPFTYGMETTPGLAIMLGVMVGGISGGLVSAMLLGIPGTPASVATTFDGLPMVRKGEQGYALGLGLWASCIGGFVSGAVLFVLAPPLGQIGLEIGPWGYFCLILFALTITASLSDGNMIKGLIAACIGLLATAVGEDQVNGITRLTFGNGDLDGGFAYLPILIGVFAFSQLLSDMPTRAAARRTLSADAATNVRIPHLRVLKQIVKHWLLTLRSIAIGVFVGVLPAAGASISNLISYDQARKNSKNPEAFGTGTEEGIIAPESTNNATMGGALMVLVALGIPGDAAAAAVLAALLVHDVAPSPTFMTERPDVVYVILLAFVIGHIFVLLLQSAALKIFIRIVGIPIYILAGVILLYTGMGVFAINNTTFDIWTMFLFGMVGYLMMRFNFPLAPLILGTVLGPIGEVNLMRAMQISPDLMNFITRPWALLFLTMAILSLLFPFAKARSKSGYWKYFGAVSFLLIAIPMFMMQGSLRPIVGAALIVAAVWTAYRKFSNTSHTHEDLRHG